MANLASVFGSPCRQAQRPLRLSFPDDDAPACGCAGIPTIVIERLEAQEPLWREVCNERPLLADSIGSNKPTSKGCGAMCELQMGNAASSGNGSFSRGEMPHCRL